jgi:hypothetical protein
MGLQHVAYKLRVLEAEKPCTYLLEVLSLPNNAGIRKSYSGNTLVELAFDWKEILFDEKEQDTLTTIPAPEVGYFVNRRSIKEPLSPRELIQLRLLGTLARGPNSSEAVEARGLLEKQYPL